MRESCSKEQIKSASLSKNSGVRTRLIAKFLSTERSALVEKTSEYFWNSLKESEKNYSLERLKVKWRQKKKKKNGTVWFMRESCGKEADQNCPFIQRPQKAFEGEITNKWRQISNKKNF